MNEATREQGHSRPAEPIAPSTGPLAKRSTTRRTVLVIVAWLTLASAMGCVSTRLQPEQLPEHPIAFLHWPDKAGSKRAEIFEESGKLPPPPVDEIDPERFEEFRVRAYLRGDALLSIMAKLAKYPGQVMLLWPQTGRVERVDSAPFDALPLAWSADGKRLLIASAHRGGRAQLFEYHMDRKDLSPVTSDSLDHERGTYNSQGRVVTHQIERVTEIGVSANTLRVVDVGGVVGPALATDVPPGSFAVDPSGEQAVYEQVRLRQRRDGPTMLESWIATQSLTGASEEQLLAKGREPALTPDGNWIVFASPTAAGYRLRRMRPDGTSKVPLGRGGNEERMPAVSPDGEFVAFSNSVHGRRRLTVRRFDGKDERVLLESGWSEFPVW